MRIGQTFHFTVRTSMQLDGAHFVQAKLRHAQPLPMSAAVSASKFENRLAAKLSQLTLRARWALQFGRQINNRRCRKREIRLGSNVRAPKLDVGR